MPRPPRRRTLVVAAVLLVVVAAVVTVVVLQRDEPATRLAAAMELAPDDAVRYGWTDWSAVRERVGADTDEAADEAGEEAVRELLDAAFDADLTPMSALVSSAPTMASEYGVSPATLDWELFTQSEAGAAVLMGLPDELSLDDLRAQLVALGYTQPDEPDGVWEGGPDLLTGIGSLTPELAYLSLDAENGVLAASDEASTLSDLPSHRRGDTDTGATDAPDGSAGGIDEVVRGLGDVDVAAVYAGSYACGALAMTQADDAARSEAAGLVERAGDVHAYDAYGVGLEAGRGRVAMAFESEEYARADADSRADLAVGAAPGQGVGYPDLFETGEVRAEDRLLTIDVVPTEDAFVLSELASGPVLLATC